MKTNLYIAEAVGNHPVHYHEQVFLDTVPTLEQIAEAANFTPVDWTLRYLGEVPYRDVEGGKFIADADIRKALADFGYEIIRFWQDRKKAFAAVQKLFNQAKCHHNKGKVRLVRNGHTIICGECDCAWKPKDTKEYFLRFGKEVINHTKIGWKEAQQLLPPPADLIDADALAVLGAPTN